LREQFCVGEKTCTVMLMAEQIYATPISQSDRAFIQQFYEENKQFLFFLAGKYVSTWEDCEDVVQESMIRFIRNRTILQELDRVRCKKYILLTVRSAVLDMQRKQVGNSAQSYDEQRLDALICRELIKAEWMSSISAKLDVQQLRQELSSREWILLEGKYIYGYSNEELGRRIDVSADSVRSLLSRARKKARTMLAKEGRVKTENKE